MRRRNATLFLSLLGTALFMMGVSYAAVPLYALFCRVTGFGGTPQIATAVPDAVLDRTMRVRFVAATSPGLPWGFRPAEREIEVRLGEPMTAFYVAENEATRPITGVATFNVTPEKAGAYFAKVQCFCFDEQVLQPGQRAELPVYFYVDPALAADPGLDDVKVITLSYTFFAAEEQAAPSVSPTRDSL